MKVIVCRGLPGSGRREWSKQYVIDNPSAVRVCRSDMRKMIGNYTTDKEGLMIAAENSIIRECIVEGRDVVIDGNNLNPRVIESIEMIFHDLSGGPFDVGVFGIEGGIEIKDFDCPLEEALDYDFKREKPLGEKRISQLHSQYLDLRSKIIRMGQQ